MTLPQGLPPSAGANTITPLLTYDASRYNELFKNMTIPRNQRREPSPPEDTPSESLSATSSSRPSFSARSSPRFLPGPEYDSSPDPRRGYRLPDPADLTPLSLPPSPIMETSTATETIPASRPGGGLIRRLSSAGGRRLRGRSSAANIKTTRDQNAGSMIRRRSDSRTQAADGCYDEDHETHTEVDEGDDHTPLTTASPAPASQARPRMFSLSRKSSITEATSNRTPTRSLSRRTSATDTSQRQNTTIIPQPTVFTKISKKKRKQLRFTLDDAAGKMYWSSSSSSMKKQVYIDDIREVRPGSESTSYMEANNESDLNTGCWLTIVYVDPERSKGRASKLMHLVASDERTRDTWLKALKHVMKTRDARMVGMVGNSEKHWLAQWKEEMVKRFGRNEHPESDERVDFATIRRICRSVSIFKSDRDLKILFDSVGETKPINQEQYLKFFRLLTERQEVRRIFDSIKRPGATMISQDEFFHFVHISQNININDDTRPAWDDIFRKYASKGKAPTEPEDPILCTHMTFEGFRSFLGSSANAALASKPEAPTLDRPLSEYFISSSHNTYLAGRQWWGESSPEMYSEALKRGCRCLEIDCADGPDGKPIVTHVNTSTSKVLFMDCIKAINQYAFWASDYPLIISLEVHCKAEQQKTMANIMKDVFGSKLLTKPLIPGSYELPSPEQLKGRVLVKVKMPKGEEPATASPPAKRQAPAQTHTRTRSMSAPMPVGQPMLGLVPPRSPTFSPNNLTAQLDSLLADSFFTNPSPSLNIKTSFSGSEESDGSTDATLTPTATPQKAPPRVSKITRELGELGVYTRGVKFSSWDSKDSHSPNHVYSFNESTFEARSRNKISKAALESHNMHHLMRVYPKWQRLDSTNFNPLQVWRRGVQMVATNWQTYDLGSQLNDAMFASGADRTGYVLKPIELRRSRETAAGERLKLARQQVKFSVNIISAQYLEASDTRTDADMNPYVVLEMFYPEDKGKDRDTSPDISPSTTSLSATSSFGSTTSSSSTSSTTLCSTTSSNTKLPSAKASTQRTPTVLSNGFDPVFDPHELNTFSMTAITKHPDLIFVRFSVYNCPEGKSSAKGEPIATFTAKLRSLKGGYRHLPLYSRNGELLHSKLFVKVKREEARPWGMNGVAGVVMESGASGVSVGGAVEGRVSEETKKRWWKHK